MGQIYRSPRRTSTTPTREYLVAAREAAGKTQLSIVNEIQDKFGVIFTRTTLSRWEAGTRKVDIDVLSYLANVYGLSMDYMAACEIQYLKNAGLAA